MLHLLFNLKVYNFKVQFLHFELKKAKTWETAIGLQDVDCLKPSEYLLDTA